MKRFLVLTILLIASGAGYAQADHPEATAQQKFISGGTVLLHLEAGGYTIRPTDAANIVVTCHAHSEERLKEVKVQIKLVGSHANVYVTNTPNNNFNATIEVPQRSNLWVHLTTGPLTIRDLGRDTDLQIQLAHPCWPNPRPQY